MSHQISELLSLWFNQRHHHDWVLGTLYKTQGSAYQKAGAMLFMNSLGQRFGLLSGGCLESDILINAKRVFQNQTPLSLVYDSTEEGDGLSDLGVGCGGKIYIQLQNIESSLTLTLEKAHRSLAALRAGALHLELNGRRSYFTRFANGEAGNTSKHLKTSVDSELNPALTHTDIVHKDNRDWLITPLMPEPHILIVGGGDDAQPLVAMAKVLGWRITVIDPRVGYARPNHFQGADNIIRHLDLAFESFLKKERIKAVIIMSHNLKLDTMALKMCQPCNLNYLALLGPKHRFHKVLTMTGLSSEDFHCPISAPAGISIGGRLPESIALSILAECHSVIMSN